MNTDNEPITDIRQFNMDLRDLMDLADVEKDMDSSYIEGDWPRYVRGLDRMYIRLGYIMNEEQKNEFEALRTIIEHKNPRSNLSQKDYNRAAMVKAEIILRKVMMQKGIINIKGLSPEMAAVE